MTSLADLCRTHSSLSRTDIDHLHRLTAEWAFLADLSFGDLLLHVRSADDRWMIVDQVRPATNQTMYAVDFVGTWATQTEELMDRALETGQRVEDDIELNRPVAGGEDTAARVVAFPVRHGDEIIAVLTKEWVVRAGRDLGGLERNYALVFEQFTHMIEAGTFPFAGRVADSSAAPRVGDGVKTHDADATETYV
mgnify:CR=1 FL=1